MIRLRLESTLDERAIRRVVENRPKANAKPPGKQRFPRGRRRYIGGGGEIRMGGSGRTSRVVRNTRRGKRVIVTYAKLRTQAQVDRATEINEQLFGPGS